MARKRFLTITLVAMLCILLFSACSGKGGTNDLHTSHVPLPPPQPDDSTFGIDVNLNIETLDNWLGRDDVVYRDMRMLLDPAQFNLIDGDPKLTKTINGFKIVPFPFIVTLNALPVPDAYKGRALFNVTWTESGEIESAAANYVESMQILEELFPKDKAIFLLCGGAGYSAGMRTLLQFLGWDPSMIYVVGPHWKYTGTNNLDLIYTTEKGDTVYAFWRADYAFIDFDKLNVSDSNPNDDNGGGEYDPTCEY